MADAHAQNPERSRPDRAPVGRSHRIRRAATAALRLALLALAAGYFTGQVLTDHYFWTQWLFWTPPEAWLLGIWALTFLALATEPSGPRRRWGRWSVVLAALVVVLHVATTHWRVHNALLRSAGPTALRVYHWNATEATDESLQAFLRRADPFAVHHDSEAVVVLANPPLRLGWGDIVRMLADRPIEQAELPQHLRRGGRFVVISGPAMSAAGWTGLDLGGNTIEPGLLDNGTAIFARIETNTGPTTLWGWDWPSDPTRGRMAYVEHSLAALDDSTHLRFAPTAAGPMQRTTDDGFPTPEIVVGDFNTARRSASVAALLPGLASAHAQAGIGPDYGWPRLVRIRGTDRATIPFLGLDQAFVDGSRWRVTAYRMIDVGQGTHRAQEVILTEVRSAMRPQGRAAGVQATGE